MRVDDFDFDLPEECIALRPAEPREAARLLVLGARGDQLADRRISDLPALLRPGDLLVLNDTKVLPARLTGVRQRGGARARVSVTLHKRVAPDTWQVFAKPARKLKTGDRLALGGSAADCRGATLDAGITAIGPRGEVTLTFDLSGPALDEAIEAVGAMPLPPYIASRRSADGRDRRDYQTVYAQRQGAVAAPTAGLHFSDALLDRLHSAGIATVNITLHVGAGTFLPVSGETTRTHKMHSEWGEISTSSAGAINRCRERGGRIVAVGTTCLRLLESAADPRGGVAPFRGETDIFILPGYRFRAVDMLLTNFHIPRSTLFMLVCAFCGTGRMKRAYGHAIAAGYRFYSYGDACLLSREPPRRGYADGG